MRPSGGCAVAHLVCHHYRRHGKCKPPEQRQSGEVDKEKKAQGWEFLFLAANIDAVETAARFGISQDRAVNYHADSQGTGVIYETVSETVCQMRAGAPMAATWSEKIQKDFKRRKK